MVTIKREANTQESPPAKRQRIKSASALIELNDDGSVTERVMPNVDKSNGRILELE